MSLIAGTGGRNSAVVLGGGIAGMLAAAALADEYASVTVVERDVLLDRPGHRTGTPQSRHVHGILPPGLAAIEELLPGLTQELAGHGGHSGDILGNVRWHLLGRQLRQAPTGLTALSVSRPALEATLRRRVRALPNVTVLDGFDVVGVATTPDRSRVTAARVTSVTGSGSRVLPTDLIVDATGRASRVPRWLAEWGYPDVPVDRVRVDLAYASMVLAAPPDVIGDDIAVVTARFPGQLRGGVLMRHPGRPGGDQIHVTLSGMLGERPPRSLPGFIAYARTLARPDIAEALERARPVGETASNRLPTYVRHRYEQLDRFPAGLVVVGDGVCNLNPIYGQGISVAAATVRALAAELRQGHEPAPRRYFAALSGLVEAPWRLSVGTDLATPGVTGPDLPVSPLTPTYLADLQAAAAVDEQIAIALVRVNAMVDPPSELLRPELAARVRHRSLAGTRG